MRRGDGEAIFPEEPKPASERDPPQVPRPEMQQQRVAPGHEGEGEQGEEDLGPNVALETKGIECKLQSSNCRLGIEIQDETYY